MQTVGIAGVGLRLAAIAHLLDHNGVDAYFWHPEGGDRKPPDLPDNVREVDIDALSETPLVFVWVPIHRMRLVGRRLGDVLDGRHVLVHLSRTMEYETLHPVSTLLGDETPTQRFGFFSGPMGNRDVLEDRGASGVCSSVFPEITELVEEVLSSETFRVYRNTDLAGTEAAATYSRILALAFGLAEELEISQSLRSTLFARGLAEMGQFVQEMGGEERTTFGLAGAGNLHADTTGRGSTDYRIGQELAERSGADLASYRDDLPVVEEEVFALLETLAGRTRSMVPDLHIMRAVHDGILGDTDFDRAFERLMTLPDFEE